MINPAAIPQITGDMGALAAHATTISGVGTAFADTGSRVHSTWQGLAAVYDAPEAGQLFAATLPVQSVSASVGQDITAVGGALSTYATEVTAIKARLEALRAQATTFVETVTADEDWRENEGDVDRHNQLISDVNAAVADFMDAQRRCANTILALYSDRRYTVENGDGTVTADEFGYTREMLDGAMGEDGTLPWGTAEEHDRGLLGDVGAFFGGVGEGFVGMVTGLGALIGYSDGHWSWGTAGTAWAGLGTFAVAISVYTMPGGSMLDQTIGVPGFQRGQLGTTLTTAGKALIAYDTWGEDNARAAGMTTFNVVSAIIGTKGAGASLRGGGAAVQGSRFAAVSTVGAGMVRAGEFLGRLPTVSSVVGGIARRIPGLHVPHIDVPAIDVPTHHVDTPRIDSPTPAHTPDGPTVGDAVAHTPDAPRIDVPDTRVDADVPHRDGADPGPDQHPGGGDHTPDADHTPADHTSGDHTPDADSTSADDRPGDGAPAGDGIPTAAVPATPDSVPPAVHEPLVRDQPLPTQELQSRYRGENDPTNPNRAFYPDTVHYMSPQELAEHRVVVIDGHLHWADDGSLLDTSTAGTVHSGAGRAMFVMDEHGNLYASLEQRIGELHHSSFLGGRPVAGAGEIVVHDGVTTIISRKSGHYRPADTHQQTVSDMLAQQGLDVSGITFESGF